MHLAEIWRYPVKSLRGEQLDEVELLTSGIAGDRIVHVRAPDGRTVTSRTRPRLLGLSGSLGSNGEPLIDGRPWTDEASRAAVEAAAGAGSELVAYDGLGPARFDVLPLSILTDGAIAALGVDRRRLRPNLVIAGVDGLDERTWEGRRIRIGDATVAAVRLRSRCVMTTFDPDTQQQDVGVLRRIVNELEGTISLDSVVLEPGRIRIGDRVALLA
jgi:uncharacterized protein